MLSLSVWTLSTLVSPARQRSCLPSPPPVSAQVMGVTAARLGWGRQVGLPLVCCLCSLLASFEELLPPLFQSPLSCEDTKGLISCYNNIHHLRLHLAGLFIPPQIMDLPAR